MNEQSTSIYKAITMWGLLAIFSFMQFFVQVSGNTMGNAWQVDFGIDPIGLGLLNSSFFYAYFIVQVLAGFLYDYWGAKRVVRLAVSIFVLGLMLFGLVHSFYWECLARVLVGAGAGFAFIGMVYIAAIWFSASLFIVFVGLGELLSMLLTAGGQWLAGIWVLDFGWRAVILGLSALGFILLMAVFCILRDPVDFTRARHPFFRTFWQSFRIVVQIKAVWLAGVFCAGMFGVITIFASLWGSYFLQDAYQYRYLDAIGYIAFIPLGLAFGGPLLGWINGRYISTLLLVRLTAAALLLLAIGVIFAGGRPMMLMVLLSLIGCFGGANVLAFYIVETNVAPHIRGIAVGFCNALAIGLGAIFQYLIGLLFHVLGASPSAPPYLAKLAMLPFVISILFAFIAACFFKAKQN